MCLCTVCRIPEDLVRSWADSFEKVMSSEGKMNILLLNSLLNHMQGIFYYKQWRILKGEPEGSRRPSPPFPRATDWIHLKTSENFARKKTLFLHKIFKKF